MMKIYVTRHGQVLPEEYVQGNHMFPVGDLTLSEKGEKQAEQLGQHMKNIGFSGTIYASPFVRTMQTAQMIADHTGSKVVPLLCIHEIFKTQKSADEFSGQTKESLQKLFPSTVENFDLPDHWWPKSAETEDEVLARVTAGLSALSITEDVLFVGHGASVWAMNKFFDIPAVGMVPGWNCSLMMKDTETGDWKFADVSHLDDELVTSNKMSAMEDYNQRLANNEEVYRIIKGRKTLLHIGDIPSLHYDDIREVIERVKPYAIVHTGDFADEIKVGCKPEVKEEYLRAVEALLSIMKESTAEVFYFVPGNNDLPEEILRIYPEAKQMGYDDVIEVGGKRFCLSHERFRFSGTKEADSFLYGHTCKQDLPEDDPKVYCNALANSTVHLLDGSKEVYKIHNFYYKPKKI